MTDKFREQLEEEYQAVVDDVEQWEKEEEKSRTYNFMGMQFIDPKPIEQDFESDNRFSITSLAVAITVTFLWALFYLG